MAFPILGTPKPTFFGSDGSLLASGTLSILEPADDTNKNYYPTADDADALTNAANGDLTLNARGEPTNGLWGIDSEDYKLVLKDASGSTIWTTDDVTLPPATQAGVGKLLYPRTAAETSAGVTPTNYQYEPGNVLRYGTNTTPGTTDMTTAIQAAFDSSLEVFFPEGAYYVPTQVAVSSKTGLRVSGSGAVIESNPGAEYYAFALTSCTDAVISGLTFDGKVDENNTHRPSVFLISACTDLTIRDCLFNDVFYAIATTGTGSERLTATHNSMRGTADYTGSNAKSLCSVFFYDTGTNTKYVDVSHNYNYQVSHLCLGSTAQFWNVCNNKTVEAHDSSIYLFGNHLVISGNEIIDAGKDGIKILDDAGVTSNLNIISNNFVKNAGQEQSDGGNQLMCWTDNSIVSNNVIEIPTIASVPPADVSGISLSGDDIVCEGNVIKGATTNGNGIVVSTVDSRNCNDISIRGNSIEACSKQIVIGQTGTLTIDNVEISGNHLRDSPTGIIFTAVTASKVDSPTISGNFLDGQTAAGMNLDQSVTDLLVENNRFINQLYCARGGGLAATDIIRNNHTDGNETLFVQGSSAGKRVGNLTAQTPIADIDVGIKEDVVIADDGVYSFTPKLSTFHISLHTDALSAAGGIAQVETGGTNSVAAIALGADMEVSNSVLTGTTGSDAKLTVSCNSGTVYIENRLGSQRTIRYSLT